MITTKELCYVNNWARKAPYPGIGYCMETVELLKQAWESYHKHYKDKEYNIIFSNAEEITLEILPLNLCHMLGIDYQNLCKSEFQIFRQNILDFDLEQKLSAYELLKRIIENMDKVIEYDYENNGKILNYYRIRIKCTIFDKLSDFSCFNFACINFNKEEYARINHKEYSGNSNKLLFVSSNEAVSPYFIMGIKKDSNLETKTEPDNYIVESLFAPSDPKSIFMAQEVVIPTQILISDNHVFDKLKATTEEKLQLLHLYRSIVNEYQIPNGINIYGDYMAMLAEQHKIYTKK